MSNKASKPLTIVRIEFINSLMNLINDSDLPLLIIEPIIKDLYSDIHTLNQKQLEIDLKLYADQKGEGSSVVVKK